MQMVNQKLFQLFNSDITMEHSKEQIKEIMLSLYQQLGGHKFVVMTGSEFTGYMENESGNMEQIIKLSRNKSGADKLIVTYEEGKDVYSMFAAQSDLPGVQSAGAGRDVIVVPPISHRRDRR